MTAPQQLPDPLVPLHVAIIENARARLAPEEADFRPALSSRPHAGTLPESEMPTYNEKLRDPRWQRMRLEVMQRDGFACRFCQSGERTLNVHHLFYAKGRDPWDYPAGSLLTLCEECHSYEHEWGWKAGSDLLQSLRTLGAASWDMGALDVALTCPADRAHSLIVRQLTSQEWLALADIFAAFLRTIHKEGDAVALASEVERLAPPGSSPH